MCQLNIFHSPATRLRNGNARKPSDQFQVCNLSKLHSVGIRSARLVSKMYASIAARCSSACERADRINLNSFFFFRRGMRVITRTGKLLRPVETEIDFGNKLAGVSSRAEIIRHSYSAESPSPEIESDDCRKFKSPIIIEATAEHTDYIYGKSAC